MMFVIKRDGRIEIAQIEKISKRISKLINKNEEKFIDSDTIAQKTMISIYDKITTEEIDLESAKICINLCTTHYLYSNIASRILVSNLHKKRNNKTFVEKENYIQNKLNLLDNKWLEWINENKEIIDNMIDYSRDYIFDYFGFKTLEHSYLIKFENQIIETPQDMFMRVASFINRGDLELTKKTYDLLSQGYYIHATPTLFNSGNKYSQLASCFLMGTNDSLNDITKTWSDVSKISKWGGGIGLHITNIRSKSSLIRGTNGPSSGIIPMLKVYNEIIRYVDQCFIGVTKIYTNNGLVKLEKIKSNDKVFTNDGTLQNVKRVYCDYYKGKILNFKIKNDYQSIKVTPNHSFYVIKNLYNKYNNNEFNNESNNKNIIDQLNNNIINHEWIDAINIKKDDFIGFPIPTYIRDNNNLDDSDCYFYAIILANGYINDNNFVINIDILKKNIIEFTQNYLKQYDINYNEEINEIYHKINWINTSKFKFVKSQFINENNEKYIDRMILNLPEIKNKYIIKGLIDTIGNIDEEITIETHENIIDGIKYILLKMGILCSGFELEIESKHVSLTIPISDKINKLFNLSKLENLNYFEFNNILYTKIENVNEEYIETNIYDLEIENNSNYLTQAGLVHNGGKRKGSIAFYLEPHHSDIMAFLELRKNVGAETERARDLFTAVWVSDLFMKQVEIDGDWYLMCPDTCRGLTDVYGEEYENLYWKYVNENKYKNKIKARTVMKGILDSQLETGTPYIAFKDSINKKSNQKNIGTIKSSNLCVEILEYSDHKEYAVCNLASIAINKFIEPFNYNKDDEWLLYSKDDCKFCNYVKNIFNNKEIKYIEIKNKLPESYKTYPQIYHNRKYIGGYNELFDYIKGNYNYDKLYETVQIVTRNLNKLIDINFYPVQEAKLSNLKHRPMGIGIQGLADALVLLRIPFDSDESLEFNKKIMEIIYLASINTSKDISKERYNNIVKFIKENNHIIPEFYDSNLELEINNDIYHNCKLNGFELEKININNIKEYCGSYSTFEGSPFSEGIFQFDMWNVKPTFKKEWDILKEEVKLYGVRNSLLTALMPTASTSQILGNNECFEFFTNNIYTRKTIAGDFPLVNKYLIDDLNDINIWSTEIKQMIIANNGSISNLSIIPDKIRKLYKTIWEIKQIWVLKNALARSPFIDQTQSMNIFMSVPDYQKLYSSHYWAWKNGLKTGIYYLRSKPSKDATKITIDNSIFNKIKNMNANNEICESCSA